MAINEAQLETWSRQGSVAQSAGTYATVRTALEDVTAAYYPKNYSIFLQGSYGNDTNIYADSDVDVVIKLESIYYNDLSSLTAEEVALYNSARSAGTYSFDDFKREVVAQLIKKFGSGVKPGSKAIFIPGNGSRRDADVLAAVEFRKYLRFRSFSNEDYVEGICFWTKDGVKIINYPKLHSENCTTKHQATNSWFKPTVRILKNMRNNMVAQGYLNEGVAPSYFLEGLLYNMPNYMFGNSFTVILQYFLKWLGEVDKTTLLCANVR
jgi:hypothetical protein